MRPAILSKHSLHRLDTGSIGLFPWPFQDSLILNFSPEAHTLCCLAFFLLFLFKNMNTCKRNELFKSFLL